MWVKIHRSSRTVIAICDENLLGKKFNEGIKCLNITESFFKGEKISKEEVSEIMKFESLDGSTFNMVGKETISLAIEVGIIEKSAIKKIKDIPFIIIV